jgi:hypothetical protein
MCDAHLLYICGIEGLKRVANNRVGSLTYLLALVPDTTASFLHLLYLEMQRTMTVTSNAQEVVESGNLRYELINITIWFVS